MFKDYFIPHAGNDYQPHSIQRTALLLMSVLVLLTFVTTSLQSLLWISSDWLVSTILPAVIVELTNDERVEGTLSTLTRNVYLDAAATKKAEHMAKNGYFAHYSPTGISPWYWFADVGYSFMHAGENLAVHFTDSDAVVTAWMNSPSHRANIMNGNYAEIGVGTARGEFQGYPTIFVVQLFGTPLTTAVVPSPLTEADEDQLFAQADIPVVEPARVLAESVTAPGPNQVVVEAPVIESFMATSLPLERLTGETILPAVPATVASSKTLSNVWWQFIVRPQTVLQGVYAAVALFVIISLVCAVGIEIRRQQPLQVAYAVVLLVLMGGLVYLQATLSAVVVV